MKKNQIITGNCVDYTFDGLGVVKNDTFCLFVKDMAIGDEAEIVVTSLKKDYGYGKIVKLIKPSIYRTDAPCEISRPCGGCQLQHLNKQGQAEFKRNHIINAIRNIGKLDNEVDPIVTMDNPYQYRNKIMLPVGLDKEGKVQIGFYRYNSHEIIPFNNCILQSDKANDLVYFLKEKLEEYQLGDKVRHIMIRDMERTSEMMLVFVTYQKKVDFKNIVQDIIQYQNNVVSIIQNINSEDTNVVLGKEDILLYGKNEIEDELCGLRFLINAHSFYQVNTRQTEVLYSKAIELANLQVSDEVCDLYCGVGTIGLIASKHCKHVTGVEIVKEAIENGIQNAKNNGITNVDFICGDAKKVALDLAQQNKKFDCLFIDPPRKGCSLEAIDTLKTFDAKRIVYVSCNPSTLARDLHLLNDIYNIERIIPVDMFPNTFHVESVALLSKINN